MSLSLRTLWEKCPALLGSACLLEELADFTPHTKGEEELEKVSFRQAQYSHPVRTWHCRGAYGYGVNKTQ